MFKTTVSMPVPALARGMGTNITRTLFPAITVSVTNSRTATRQHLWKTAPFFIRRPTAGPTTSILSSARPSPASVSSRTPGSATTTPLSHPDLPPPLKAVAARPTFAKLTPEQISEMQALRLENPAKYTRSYLAKKYNVSEIFVQCYVPASKEVQVARLKAQQRAFEKKGWKAQEIVIQRQKRRALW